LPCVHAQLLLVCRRLAKRAAAPQLPHHVPSRPPMPNTLCCAVLCCAALCFRRAALLRLLGELVEDFEVMRRGGNAASSATIDLDDAAVQYLPL
jgi:hypothetical protein